MPAQRARSAVTADHRSAHPNIPGVPWWGAVVIAATLTAIGFAFDAGSGAKELSMAFAASYAVGCVLAVLAVRQSGIFTAVIQPPLLLFVAVPSAYFLFHGAQFTGIKDTLINYGYPLIERFPVMFFTSAAVLLIGMARWYFGMAARGSAPTSTADEGSKSGFASSLTSKVSSLFTGEHPDSDSTDDTAEPEAPRRRHTIDRPSRAAKSAAPKPSRAGRPTQRTASSRSRHARPPETELIEPVTERPRRPRGPRQTEPPPVPPSEPRRRARASSREPREPRRPVPPTDRRAPYERPERRRRMDDYEPLEPHGTNGNGTHHPVSRVRYRGADEAESHAEYRPPRRAPRDREPDGWEYDV